MESSARDVQPSVTKREWPRVRSKVSRKEDGVRGGEGRAGRVYIGFVGDASSRKVREGANGRVK